MTKWWLIAGSILFLIGMALLVWHTHRSYTTQEEGFQTAGTQATNSQVFLVQVNSKPGILTKTAGAAVCNSIGARVATLDELKAAATAGMNLQNSRYGWITYGFPQKPDLETNYRYSTNGTSVTAQAPVISRSGIEALCGITYASTENDTSFVDFAINSTDRTRYYNFGFVYGSGRSATYRITTKNKAYVDRCNPNQYTSNTNYQKVADVFCYGERPTAANGLSFFPANYSQSGKITTANLPQPYFGSTSALASLPSLTSAVQDGSQTYTMFDMDALMTQAKILQNDYRALKRKVAQDETNYKNGPSYDRQRQRIRQGFELYRAIGADEQGNFTSANYTTYLNEHLGIINNDINNIIARINGNPVPALLQLKRIENSEMLKIYSLTPAQTNDGSCLPIFLPYNTNMPFKNVQERFDWGWYWEAVANASRKIVDRRVVVDGISPDVEFWELQINGIRIYDEGGSAQPFWPSDGAKGNPWWKGRNMGLHRCFDPKLMQNYSQHTCNRIGLPVASPLVLKYLYTAGSWIDYEVDWFKYVFPNNNILYYALDRVSDVCPPTLVNFTRGNFRSDFLTNRDGGWDFTSRASLASASSPSQANDTLIQDFKLKKNNTPSKYLWRAVNFLGTISATNKEEIGKSVSLSIYFNLGSGSANIEEQLRIDTSDPTKLYMSPTSGALPEVKQQKTTTQPAQFVLVVDNEAKTNNDIVCVPLTTDDLFYIPYHLSRFIVKWADSRADRIKKFLSTQVAASGAVAQASLATNQVQTDFITGLRKPIFDMASVVVENQTPKRYLTPDQKKAILNKMAQLYYDRNNGSVRIQMILDVFQIGNTIFDIRFKYSKKISDATRRAIKQLTDRYYALRSNRLTETELLTLEADYQQRLSDYYKQEEENTTDNVTCSSKKARFIEVRATTAGERIRLSQIVVVADDGSNAGLGVGVFTYFSTLNCVLSPYAVPQELFAEPAYAFDGTKLEGQTAIDQVNRQNTLSRQNKLALLIDGTLTPRSDPAIYESLYSSFTTTDGASKNNDFLMLDLGSESFINAVKLVLPDDGNAAPVTGAAATYTITLLDYYKRPLASGSLNVTGSLTNPSPVAVFINTNDPEACARDLRNPYRAARFFADVSQQADTADRDVSKITFTGFTEDTDLSDPTRLNTTTFNPLYNGGFALDLNAQSGNQNYKPITNFSQNFTATEQTLNCQDLETIKTILREYNLSLGQNNFLARADVQALDPRYRPDLNDYFVSSINATATIASDTCAIQWYEQKYERTTYATAPPVLRTGTFKMTADMQNWYSPRIIYDVSASRLYANVDAYTAANPGKALASLAGAPIKVDMPLPADRTLDDGNGACPQKRCSDTDVIGSIITAYNALSSQQKVLRVNKAVTANFRRCDYEVVLADYGATGGSIVTTISTMVTLDTPTCTYGLASGTIVGPGSGKFVTDSTPYLTKIYTYVNDFMEPVYSSLMKNITELIGLGDAQTADTGLNIKTSFKTYRTDTLAAYGALKQLKSDKCFPTDTTNRCYDPGILNSFIKYHSNTFWQTQRLKTIQRAATSADNECDFTFDTTDMGYDLAGKAVNEGQPMTRAFRCRVAADPNGCAFTLSTATYVPEEVYSVTTPVPAIQMAGVCEALGGRVATTTELAAAATKGASWFTTPGWVSDAIDGYAPAGSVVGISTFVQVDPAAQLAVNCIGPKPPQGTPGVAPFNATRYAMPTAAIYGPCIAIEPVEPTADDLANVGFKPNTALGSATPAAYSTTTTTTLVTPYVVRATALSPLDYIDCQSDYAIAQIGTYPISKIAQLSISSCAINGTTMVTFAKVPGSDLLGKATTGPVNASYTAALDVTKSPAVSVAPPLNLATPIGSDADCLRADILNATGIQAAITGAGSIAKRIDANTCEYRITARNDAPFGDTFKRVGFYTQAGATSVKLFQPATPATSPFVFQPPLATATNLTAQAQTLVNAFRAAFNDKYYDRVEATEKVFKQRVGKITDVGYFLQEDAVIFKGKYVQIGPLGDLDVRFFSNVKLFKVVFRNRSPTDATANVYSMMPIDVAPAGVTLNGFSDTLATENDVKSTEEILGGSTKFRMVKFTNTSAGPIEVYRLNFFSKAAGSSSYIPIILSRASATITDPGITGKPELYDRKFYVDGPGLCTDDAYIPYSKGGGQYYGKGVDPVSKFSTCTLNTSLLPQNSQTLYSYPLPAGIPCKIGYGANVDVIVQTGLGPNGDLTRAAQQIPPPFEGARYLVVSENKIYQFKSRSFGTAPIAEAPLCNMINRFSNIVQSMNNDNLNNYTQRLVLRSGQSIIIRFNDYVDMAGYAVVAGSWTYRPTAWTLEGSINGLVWVNINTQTNYSYNKRSGLDFANTNIITIPTTTSDVSYTPAASYPTGSITPLAGRPEGFQNPARSATPAVEPYRVAADKPLDFTPNFYRTRAQPVSLEMAPVAQATAEPQAPHRMTWFRFRTLETRDPAAKFVNLSEFRFYTTAGTAADMASVKITNLGGVRKSPREGPDALKAVGLMSRWVDYSKSPLLFRFETREEPFIGIRFTQPAGPDAASAMPSKWILDGSYDGRIWTILYDSRARPRGIQGTGSSVYRFAAPI